MSERWLPVVGHEGAYEVSDQGRVRSLDRIVLRGGRPMKRRGGILAGWTSKRGYHVVRLGRGRDRYVHHLVLEAFVGARGPGEECCHGLGGPLDNRLENLRWGTSADNKRDQVLHGTHSRVRRTHCPREHPLAAPNLLPGRARRGYRACLACHLARNWARGKALTAVEFKATADRFYAGIVGVMPLS
jgi:hypothetical protein